jgi:hypothetical protein
MKQIILILTVFVATSYGFHPAAVNKSHSDIVLICQSKDAKVYHSHECSGLAHCTHQVVKISKSEAIKMGRRACRNCYR